MMKIPFKHIAVALAMMAGGATVAVAAEAPAQDISVSQAPQVSVKPGQIQVDVPGDAPCHVAVYSLTGQVVRQFTAASGSTTVDLPAGHYIVRVAGHAVKVVVK